MINNNFHRFFYALFFIGQVAYLGAQENYDTTIHREIVQFNSLYDGTQLEGTLTLPQTKKKCPGLILVTGSGPQNRNEELFGLKPFEVLAEFLTRKGYAVLRYDDRGVGNSKGEFQSATTKILSIDAESAFNVLRNRPEVNKKQVGIIGHSEGGIIAPMIASRNKHVDFIVLLAGTGVRGDSVLLKQLEDIGAKLNTPKASLDKNLTINSATFSYIVNHPEYQAGDSALSTFLKNEVTDIDKLVQSIGISFDSYLKTYESQWLVEFIRLNPQEYLKDVRCHVLAMNGDLDLQVNASINLNRIKEILLANNCKHVETHLIPNHNHMFQKTTNGLPLFYALSKEAISDETLNIILTWLNTLY